MMTLQLIVQMVRDHLLHMILTYSHFTADTPTTSTTAEQVSWEDIEEEISMETGTVKLFKCTTVAIAGYL